MARTILTASRRRLLDALLAGPRSLSALESETGRSKPALLTQLRALEADGLVQKETSTTRVGRETRYSLRPYTYVLRIDPDTGTALTLRASEALDVGDLLVGQVPQAELRRDVRAYLASLARAFRGSATRPWVILFGSVARGEATWKSDIDALLILPPGRAAEAGLRRALSRAAPEADHLLKPHFVTLEAFLRSHEGIVAEAREQGIVVWEGSRGAEIWRQLKRYRSISS